MGKLAYNNAENQVAIAKAGAIPPLIALTQEGTPVARGYAAGALSNLSVDDEIEQSIAELGLHSTETA